MTMEAFLINPKRKKKGKTRRANPLPGGLLSRMMKKYGRKRGMKEAWKAYKGGGGVRENMARPATKVPSWVTSRHPKIKELVSKRSRSSRSKLRKLGFSLTGGAKSWEKFRKRKPIKNPFGEEVIVVGANPRRKKSKSRRRTSLARYLGNVGTRSGALKGWRKRSRLLDNPKRRRRSSRFLANRKRSVRYLDNRKRRFRRNPAAVATMGGISLQRPMTLIMPIVVGLAARIATQRVPTYLGIVSPLPRYGVQAAVAVGGGLLLNRFVGKTNAMVWTIVSGVTILEDILNRYVFGAAGAVAGLGYYEPEQVGAFPEEPGVGAYPYGEEVNY